MSEPEKNAPIFGMHYGDLGVVALAVLFLLAFLGLMFAPAPLKGLDKFDKVAAHDREATIAKLEKARRQKEIDDAVASGVVTVGIAPARH
jgi:hypothetical protein